MKDVDFKELVGKTIVKIEGAELHSEVINFRCSDGSNYRMFHEQDCCEGVNIDDIVGDISDLLDSPILSAEETTNSEDTFGMIESPDSFTWTFYHIATIKGNVTLKWLGESNGYYSESVTFCEL